MNKLNTTANGGHPIELDDLRWMDAAYRKAFLGILSAFGISPAETFVLSGCVKTITGTTVNVTEGYVSVEGEVLFLPAQSYAVPSGSEVDYFEIDISYDPTGYETFENGTPHNTYEIRNAKISVGTPAVGTVTLVSTVKTIFEVIEEKIPAIDQNTIKNNTQDGLIQSISNNVSILIYQMSLEATETVLGRIKLAHQQVVDVGIDDTRAVTPLKLKNTTFIPNILHTATIYLGTIAQQPNPYAITFPNLGTSDYRIVGYAHKTGSSSGQLTYSILNQSPTGFDLIIHCLNGSVPNAYFFYTIYKNH